MTKDQSIIDVIARINPTKRNWCIVDHWDADLCAVGIARSDDHEQLVYISTRDHESGRFYYECENSPAAKRTNKDNAEDVDFDILLKAMEKHLG